VNGFYLVWKPHENTRLELRYRMTLSMRHGILKAPETTGCAEWN
jgi:hypothetical protein